LRATEPDYALVECFRSENNSQNTPQCRLRGMLKEALAAFSGTLERYTLADLLLSPEAFDIQPAA
jgi:Rrf2 family nitric oxide-sensitive transcriptional repressor